jgi:hypothetical protein
MSQVTEQATSQNLESLAGARVQVPPRATTTTKMWFDAGAKLHLNAVLGVEFLKTDIITIPRTIDGSS